MSDGCFNINYHFGGKEHVMVVYLISSTESEELKGDESIFIPDLDERYSRGELKKT